MLYIILLLFTSLSFAEDFTLEDLNETSIFYGELVGPSSFTNEVSLVYFGHYNWGTCTTRFGQLNDLYNELILDGYTQVKLFGVGKTQHMIYLENWTDGNDATVAADGPPYPNWDDWDADQRDLYILDHANNIVHHLNITDLSNFNQTLIANTVIDLIANIPEDSILGDINGDLAVDILDVVILVNHILSPDGSELDGADINTDGDINVLDVVTLVNLILNP